MEPLRQQQLATPVVEVFLAVEEEILMSIARLLRQNDSLLTEESIESWQLANLMRLGQLSQRNVITIAKHSKRSIDEVSKMLETAGYEGVNANESDLVEAVRRGLYIEQPAIAESAVLANILTAFQAQAFDVFNLINTTMLEQSEQVFLDILNETTAKVLAGTKTPKQALRETASKWSEKGVPGLIRSDGKPLSTEAYVNSVMRSMSNRVSNEMQDARMDQYGCELIEVSAHMGARPGCAPYQGRIFARSGKHPKYSSLKDTSYGEPAGLFGINCRHVKYPFIEGITKRRFEPNNSAENKRVYEESQKQRELERKIRKAKRELAMLEEMNDPEGVELAKKKIRQRQANMRDFIKETDRTRRYEREKPY
jgi:Phage minor capsid protein 2